MSKYPHFDLMFELSSQTKKSDVTIDDISLDDVSLDDELRSNLPPHTFGRGIDIGAVASLLTLGQMIELIYAVSNLSYPKIREKFELTPYQLKAARKTVSLSEPFIAFDADGWGIHLSHDEVDTLVELWKKIRRPSEDDPSEAVILKQIIDAYFIKYPQNRLNTTVLAIAYEAVCGNAITPQLISKMFKTDIDIRRYTLHNDQPGRRQARQQDILAMAHLLDVSPSIFASTRSGRSSYLTLDR